VRRSFRKEGWKTNDVSDGEFGKTGGRRLTGVASPGGKGGHGGNFGETSGGGEGKLVVIGGGVSVVRPGTVGGIVGHGGSGKHGSAGRGHSTKEELGSSLVPPIGSPV